MEFNADEIFEIALQIERNGAAFYKRAASVTRAPNMKKRLLELASWEIEHEKVFDAMRQRLETGARTPGYFDPQGEAAGYLRAVAAGRVFSLQADPAKKIKAGDSPAKLLQTAIALENDSIALYTAMREMVPPRLGREGIDQILQQEMGHVMLLSNELAGLARR